MQNPKRHSETSVTLSAYYGPVLYCIGPGDDEYQYWEDGLLLVSAEGLIEACGSRLEISKGRDLSAYRQCRLQSNEILLPGLIDMHTHLPQFHARGKQADNLLSWLERHIYQEESRFSNSDYAETVSKDFFETLLANGTTTSCVFLTSHLAASQIAFEQAERLGNRVVMGLNLMDQNAPEALLRSAETLLAETESLYKTWHGKAKGRISYAWMPRFALSCGEPLLEGIGALRKLFPDAYLHTHISEQPGEIEAVKKQFPWAESYTDVYDHFGLLGPRTILAHGVHLSDSELVCLANHGSAIAHCPGSNFFLKSGRFPWHRVIQHNVLFGLGSDIGAGPNFSLINVMRDAQYTQTETLPLNALFYAATLGAAKALGMEETIGNLGVGKQADFVVMRVPNLADDPQSILSQLIYLSESVVAETVIQGQVRYQLS